MSEKSEKSDVEDDDYKTPDEGDVSDFEEKPKKKKVKSPKKSKKGKKTPKKSKTSTKSSKSPSPAKKLKKRGRTPSAEILEEDQDPLAGAEPISEPEEEYEVEQIVGHNLKNGILKYKIRWKNYPPSADTWENYFDLNCPDLLDAYNFKNKVKPSIHGKIKDPTTVSRKRKGSTKGKSKSNNKKSRGRPAAKKKKSSDYESSDEDDPWIGDGDSDGEYEVEKIVDVREKKNGTREFYVKWKNWAPEYNSWEPEEHLQCQELLDKFFNKVEKDKDIDERELRVVRKHTDRFTLQTTESGRRLSKRATQSQRKTYFDADDSDADE